MHTYEGRSSRLRVDEKGQFNEVVSYRPATEARHAPSFLFRVRGAEGVSSQLSAARGLASHVGQWIAEAVSSAEKRQPDAENGSRLMLTD
jgi:hypothetical protein